MTKLTAITEEEYLKVWENSPYKSFLSSPDIGKLKEDKGWKKEFLALYDDKEIVACAMVLSVLRHFKKKEFYLPRGPLLDFNNLGLLQEFLTLIKDYAKENGGYVLRIDPYVIYKQRDINGDIVEGGEDNSKVVETLEKLKFKKSKPEDQEQVSWMFSLALKGKDEQTILKEMKPNTRSTIRKAQKNLITINKIGYDELPEFQNIMIQTGKRKHFEIRPLEYYQMIYNILDKKEEVTFLITKLNLKANLEVLETEKEKLQKDLENLSDAKYNDGKRNELVKNIEVTEKKINNIKEIKEKTKQEEITLSGSMFILKKPEVIYLSSGNYDEYLCFNSQYLIQWEMIKYALEHRFDKYNFYGIPDNVNKEHKDYGIYEFKKGFNGYVEQLIGEYTLKLTWHNYVFKTVHLLRKFLQKIKK